MKQVSVVLLFLLFSSQLFAQVCKEDSAKLCPSLSGKDLQTCMRTHVADWSAECKTEVKAKLNANPKYRKLKEIYKEKYEKTQAEKKVNQAKVSDIMAKGKERAEKRKICSEKTKALRITRNAEIEANKQKQKEDMAAKKEKNIYKKYFDERTAIRNKYEEQVKEIAECK